MTLVYPEGTPTLGSTSVKAVLVMALATAPDLSTDINAATSKDISAHLFPAGWTPGATTARGSAPPRLSSKVTQERLNRTTYTIGDLQYVYDPQAADAAAGNEAKLMLVEGLELWLVERIGLDADTTAWAVGQRTRSHKVVLGPQIRMGDRTDDNAEFYIMQPVAYVNTTGPVDGVIVA